MISITRFHRLLIGAFVACVSTAGLGTAMIARAEHGGLPRPVVIAPPREVLALDYAAEPPLVMSCEDCGTKPAEKRRRHPRPGDVDRGDCPPLRYGMNPCERAGHPHSIAPWAIRSVNARYEACWVGGGLAIGGRGRTSEEGTWGLDYAGWLPRKLWLAWGAPRQGGESGYETDHVPLREKFSR